MGQLVRRFVCGRCGATAPISARPYQQCASCNAVSDYDFGIARLHADWPAHEAMFGELFGRFGDDLAGAAANNDLAGYAQLYAQILGPLMARFPALFPDRVADRAYRAQLVQFQAAWQAVTAIDSEIRDGNGLFVYLRRKVEVKGGTASPETLWPLIDLAVKLYGTIQRSCDAYPAVAPDDFVPGYITRFMVSVTVAEWLPQLAPDAQRELVKRFGVSREYIAPTANQVTCPNCGGTADVTPGFLTMPCPYCTAEIQEGRAGYRAIETNRWATSEYEARLAQALADENQPLERLEVLDGPVQRKGKSYRMITLRARFAGGRADFWQMYDKADSEKLAAVLAWVGACEEQNRMPVARLAYREHPRCASLPRDAAELARRVQETRPGAVPYPASWGDGVSVEVEVDGAVVRLARDDEGDRAKQIRAWLAG